MNQDINAPRTWPELAESLYNRLTGRNAEISYSFENLVVDVPHAVGSTESATWKLNGTIKIQTQDNA